MNIEAAISRLRRSPSLRVAAALLAGMLCAIAFVEAADEVLEGEAMLVDRPLSLWIHRFHGPGLDAAMRVTTELGSWWVLSLAVALVAAWALMRGRRALAGVLVGVALASQLLSTLLKLLFQRPRPELWQTVARPGSYAFPSGHALLSTVVYGMIAFAIARLAPRLRWPLYGGVPILVLLIGASRIYLGVHWPSDVLAGHAAGGLVLAAALLGVTRWLPQATRGPS